MKVTDAMVERLIAWKAARGEDVHPLTARELLQAALASEPEQEIGLRLCDSKSLVLRQNVLYRFTVAPGCKECERIAAAYDDSPSARPATSDLASEPERDEKPVAGALPEADIAESLSRVCGTVRPEVMVLCERGATEIRRLRQMLVDAEEREMGTARAAWMSYIIPRLPGDTFDGWLARYRATRRIP